MAMDADVPILHSEPLRSSLVRSAQEEESSPLNGWLRSRGLVLRDRAYFMARSGGIGLPTSSDAALIRDMKQPVEMTLKETGVVYLNAINYRAEVLEAAQPAMVLFYSKNGELSRGLAALAKALVSLFPAFKLCAYPLPDAKRITVDSFEIYSTRYGLRGLPTLLLYDFEDGEMEVQGVVHGGYSELEVLKYQISRLPKIIRRRIMD